MTTIKLKVTGASAIAQADGKITSGMVGVPVEIEYDEAWSGLVKTAVFRADDFSRDRSGVEGETTVPWEVLRTHGKTLFVGVEGRNSDGTIVFPTVFARVGTILQGANHTVSGADIPSSDKPNDGVGQKTSDGGEIFNDYENNAAAKQGHAEGELTEAGWRSHAEGYLTLANSTSHSEGRVTEATGKGAHAEGLETYEDVLFDGSEVVTLEATSIDAESFTVRMHYDSSILAIGGYVVLCPTSSTTGFSQTDVRRIVDIRAKNGYDPTVTYFINKPFRGTNYFEGNNAPSDGVIPAGAQLKKAIPVIASGEGAHAEGVGTKASGGGAHAEGKQTEAKGTQAHAEGLKSKAYSTAGHAEGFQTQAGVTPGNAEVTGDTSCAHAEGNNTKAYAFASHAEGQGTIATSSAQHAQGRYNVEDKDNKYAHIVGNGTATNRKNIHTLDWNGNGWFAKDVYVGGTGQDDPKAEKLVKSSELVGFAKTSDLKMKLVATGTYDTTATNKDTIRFSNRLETGKNYQIRFVYGNEQYAIYVYTSNEFPSFSSALVIQIGATMVMGYGSVSSSKKSMYFRFFSAAGSNTDYTQRDIVPNMTEIEVYELPY